jgi:ankyrin repeat protein
MKTWPSFSGFTLYAVRCLATVRLLALLAMVSISGCASSKTALRAMTPPSERWREVMNAAQWGDVAKLRALLKQDPDLVSSRMSEGQTPLHWAARNGHKEAVELLLAYKADVNAKGSAGMTALQFAARNGDIEMAKLLLLKNADVNSYWGTDVGAPALVLAAANGHKDMVALLLAHNADVNATNYAVTPLLNAVWFGQKADMAELLLDNKAEVNNARGSSEKSTPLHIAAQTGDTDLVRLLVARGADLNAKDIYGRTPLDVAEQYGNKEAATLLSAVLNGRIRAPDEMF